MLPGVGIFGTGTLLKIIVPYLRNKGFKIEALWERTLSEAQIAAKELNILYYTNKIDDVLLKKEVDLIFIICSSHIQSQISVKALGIGKHVVCDKPAGLNQIEALKMVHASEYYPSLIAIINHSLRFLPAFSRMKQLISEGFLGDQNDITLCDVQVQMGPLYSNKYNWLCEEFMGGGVVSLVGGHVIDLVTFLISQTAVKVHSVIKTFVETTEHIKGIRRITSPDYCTFQMHMNAGAVVNVTLITHMPAVYRQEFIICSKKGYLAARGSDLYSFKVGSAKEELVYSDSEKIPELENLTNSIPEPYIKGLFKMIDALKEAFLPVEDKSGWIKGPVASASSFEDGLYVHAVIQALKKSNSNRTWEYVKLMSENDVGNEQSSLTLESLRVR